MLEKRVIIDAETGIPVLEVKTNSYTIKRRPLNEEELAAYAKRQKDAISAEAPVVEEKEEAAPAAPPAPAEETAEEAPKPKAKATRKRAKPDVGAPKTD